MASILRKCISISFFIGLIISCAKYSTEDLLSAPDQIEVDGRKYILEGGLWRATWGDSLCGSIFIIATDSLSIPTSLDANHVWVINGDDIWDTDLVDREMLPGQEFMMRKMLKENGPVWEPYIYVDVVVEIEFDKDGVYLLKADSQLIHEGT